MFRDQNIEKDTNQIFVLISLSAGFSPFNQNK